MPNLVTAAQVKTRLLSIRGISIERWPQALTDPVVDEYVQRISAEVLARLGLSAAPDPTTLRRDAVDGVCLDLVLIAIRRDYFGLDPVTMQALNTQESNAWRRVDSLYETQASGLGSGYFKVRGARQ